MQIFKKKYFSNNTGKWLQTTKVFLNNHNHTSMKSPKILFSPCCL